MPILSKIFNGSMSGVVDSVSDIIDKFSLSKEEKQQFKLEMQSQLLKKEKELEETYRTELESRADIIKSEMAQGDRFTKRARPAIIYGGLIFISIVHVLVPVIAYIGGVPNNELPQIILPEEFWWAWATVVGVYGVGRSAEKMGVTHRTTQFMTGSGVNKIIRNKKAEG
ncbi:MAG: holin family protein [Bacteroidota bacterium]